MSVQQGPVRGVPTPRRGFPGGLCRDVFPGQADDVDFFRRRLAGVRCPKSGGDEDAAELNGPGSAVRA
jgi:hypothetical protein